MRLLLLVVAVLLLGVAQPAQAVVIVTGGGNINDDGNILFDAPGLITLGNPVSGMTQQPAFILLFDTIEPLVEDLATVASGQARIVAADGVGFMNIRIRPLEDYVGFQTLMLNLNATANGAVTIQVDSLVGGAFQTTIPSPFNLRGGGSNWFQITADAAEIITSVTFYSTVDLQDIRQVRVGGIGYFDPPAPEPVPEPSTLTLGAGLAALALWRRFR